MRTIIMRNFKNDLKIGKYYEELFIAKVNRKFEKTVKLVHKDTAHEADFIIIKPNNEKLLGELKSDYYPQTTNFFMEKISNISKGTVGGPWQASKYNADRFFYWFINKPENNLFIFNTNELIQHLENNMTDYAERQVSNDGYTTLGLLVPIMQLANQPFCKHHTLKVGDFEKYKLPEKTTKLKNTIIPWI